VPKPAASLTHKKDKARVALGNLAEAASGQKKEAQANVAPGNVLLNNLANKKQGGAPEQETLTEYFSERTYKMTGVRLSMVAKLSHMPMAINSVLTRINAKANDIVTLVHSIEAAAHMPMPLRMDDLGDGEFDDEGVEEEEGEVTADAEAEAEPVAANGKHRPGKAPEEETTIEEPVFEAEVVELPDDEEEVVEEVKPRRGRTAVKPPEESVDDLEALDADEDDEEEDSDAFLEADVDEDADDLDADAAEDDESGSAVAIAKAATATKRHKGRPTKRPTKKPPAKR
jgi:hypothetical protein